METKFTEADFKTTDGQVSIVRWHLLNIIVCAPTDMSRDEVERRTNEIHPSGTTNGWIFDDGKELEADKFKPLQCADDPSRTHYVLWC